jgi:predicted metal-dependent phosphoesterase TrpH
MIKFVKPDYSKLKTKGYQCVDMHFHTVHSDGSSTVNEILNKSRKYGFGIAIADHNEINGYLEADAKKQKNDFIIPAIETQSMEGIDVLFYFYTKKEIVDFFEKEIIPNRYKKGIRIKSKIPLKNLIELKNKYNCITSLAHPYGYELRSGKSNIIGNYPVVLTVDLIEAINGGNIRQQNLRAIDLIKKHNKNYTAGSDAHSIENVGRIVTVTKAKTVKEFLDNIKNGKSDVIGTEAIGGKLFASVLWIKNQILRFIK